MQLSGRDLGQEAFLLLRGTKSHDRRPDCVDGQEWDGHPGDCRFVGEDQLVENRPVLPAIFDWPSDGQPAITAELTHDLLVSGTVAVLAADACQASAAFRRHQASEVGAQLQPELLLLSGVADLHQFPCTKLERVLPIVAEPRVRGPPPQTWIGSYGWRPALTISFGKRGCAVGRDLSRSAPDATSRRECRTRAPVRA